MSSDLVSSRPSASRRTWRPHRREKDMIMDFFERYFEDAIRIYAICGDENLSDDEARLLTYIHVKALENPHGLDFLDDPEETDRDALNIMLGDCALAETMLAKDGTVVSLGSDFFPEMNRAIDSMDAAYRDELGMENRLSGELRIRRRLYEDREFRKRMVALYAEKISPRIFSCDKAVIERSFKAFRERIARRDREQQDLLNA